MTIAIAILGLAALIFIHELGHFVASLALGMRPRKFYVGFPPALVKTTRNGIEYGLGTIPLGGFVKIPGMHRPAPQDVDHAFGRALDEQPSLAGDTTRLRNALAAGDHDEARAALGAIGGVATDLSLSEPARRALDRGLEDMSDALGPDAYWRAATWRRVVAIAAGPVANIVLAIVLFAVLSMTSGGDVTTRVAAVVADSPAAEAGLLPGDRIVAIDGAPVEAARLSATIAASEGRPLTLTVLRDGEEVVLEPVSARRETGEPYRLGLRLSASGMSLPAATENALRVTWLVTGEVVASVGRLVTGEGREDLASPVGIVQGSSDAARQGADSFVWVLGLISLSIALLNLLPLLPLDGGHIVFAVLEGVRGRAVAREVYERVSIVGIGLVILLFFIGLTNDIDRLSS
jgi:regulator of sigma E protease